VTVPGVRPLGWKGLPTYVLVECGITVDSEGLVRVPYFLADGGLYAHRVVAPSGRRWWEPGDGRPVVPFGLEVLPDFHDRAGHVLFVSEGESDRLALMAAYGSEAVDTLGIPGAAMWRAEWRTLLEGFDRVYVVPDGDEAGRELGLAVKYGPSWVRNQRLLPAERQELADDGFAAALVVQLPAGKDARGILQGPGGVQEFETYIRTAEYDRKVAIGFRYAETLDELRAYMLGEPDGLFVTLRATAGDGARVLPFPMDEGVVDVRSAA